MVHGKITYQHVLELFCETKKLLVKRRKVLCAIEKNLMGRKT